MNLKHKSVIPDSGDNVQCVDSNGWTFIAWYSHCDNCWKYIDASTKSVSTKVPDDRDFFWQDKPLIEYPQILSRKDMCEVINDLSDIEVAEAYSEALRHVCIEWGLDIVEEVATFMGYKVISKDEFIKR